MLKTATRKGERMPLDLKKELLAISKEECAERLRGASAFIRNSVIMGTVKVPEATAEENKQFFNEFCLHMQSAIAIAEEIVCLADEESFLKAVEKVISNSEEWVAPYRL